MNKTNPSLSESELLHILSLSENATAVYVTDQILIQFANTAMMRMWDKDKSIIGQPLEEVLPELKGQPFIGFLQNVWRKGETIKGLETPADINIDGKLQTFYFDFTYRAILNDDGTTHCILHTAVDVTDRVLHRKTIADSELREQILNDELVAVNEELTASNEELVSTNEELKLSQENLILLNKSLAENEARFRYLIDRAPIAIGTLKGYNFLIESANEKILSLWGKSSRILNQPLASALPELKDQPFIRLLQEVLETGVAYHGYEIKAEIEHSDGLRHVYFDFVYHPLKDLDGTVNSIMIIATDVTQRVLSRLEIEKISDTLNQAVESAFMGIWSADLTTGDLTISEQGRKMHGISKDTELTLARAMQLIDADFIDDFTEAIEHSIKTGASFESEYIIHPMDGEKLRWLKATGKAYFDEQNNPLTISGTILDITEQKHDEIRKNDFIGMVSHELKTPLTSLKAYIQLLHRRAKKQEDDYSASSLSKVEIQVNKMAVMINGFLNISRLESGKIHLVKQDFEIGELIAEVIEETLLTSSSHTITFLPSDPIQIHADREKIGQVLSNFFSNAHKYSPVGTDISIACKVVEQSVYVSVKDDGMGIKAHDIEKLFERYYRIENMSTQNISGFGIGLYLCAEIIKRHDGKIWVESEIGEGSTFFFCLPLPAHFN